jgi:transposase
VTFIRTELREWRSQVPECASRVSGELAAAEADPTVDLRTLHAKIGGLTLENDVLSGAPGKAGLISRAGR